MWENYLINSITKCKIELVLIQVERARIAADEDRLLFGNVDSWLIWNLSGGPNGVNNHVTDVTNASRTMLMNLEVYIFPDLFWY